MRFGGYDDPRSAEEARMLGELALVHGLSERDVYVVLVVVALAEGLGLVREVGAASLAELALSRLSGYRGGVISHG